MVERYRKDQHGLNLDDRGDWVNHSDYEALEARCRELEEALQKEKSLSDRLASALEYIDDYCLSYPDLGTISAVAQPALKAHSDAASVRMQRDTAQAHAQNLTEALENLRSDCQYPIDTYERNGPSFTSPKGDEYEPTSYVIAKMQELLSTINEALSLTPTSALAAVRDEVREEYKAALDKVNRATDREIEAATIRARKETGE